MVRFVIPSGLEIKFFSREPNCIFKSHLQVLCIEISTFLGSLQKFEGAAGDLIIQGSPQLPAPPNLEPYIHDQKMVRQ